MLDKPAGSIKDLRIVALLDGLMDTKVEVGILVEEGTQVIDENGTTLAQVVKWNEFGTTQIPARPAFRQFAASDASRQAGEQLTADLQRADTPQDCEMALARFGERMAEGLWQAIDNFSVPPNAEATVRDKGFNKPLVRSGRMRDSVAWALSRRGTRLKKEFARR